MANSSKELDDIEYWKKSGIVVTNNEIADQLPNVPVNLSIDDKFSMCVILAMKAKKAQSLKCDKGETNGNCCCNCSNQIELFKHPWNTINKGSITESAGLYACIALHDCDGNNKGIVFEKKHGSCELHVPK